MPDSIKDEFTKESLIPALGDLKEALNNSGWELKAGLGDEAIPGLWIKRGDEPDVFCTLFAVNNGDEGYETIMRFSVPDDELERGGYIRWAFPSGDIKTVEEFERLLDTFLDGYPFRVLPDAAAAVNLSEEETDGDLRETGYGAAEFACIARLNAISDMLDDEEEIHTGVIYGAMPYLQLEYEDQVITLCYERSVYDEETFLLHLRTDIRYEGDREAAEEFCESFNFENSVTRAYADSEAFPISGNSRGDGEYITFHACAFEKDGIWGIEWLSLVIKLFVSEIKGRKSE